MALITCWMVVTIILTSSTLLLAVPAPAESSTNLPMDVKMEEPCTRSGGICLPVTECPNNRLSPEVGLCPQQQAEGVECCYGLSILEKRCKKRGGDCTPMARCGRDLWDTHAEDCSPEEACCIYVK